MKWRIRKPSLKKRIAARTSLKRYVRHSLGLKAPRGWGWLTNPKRALYNRIYYRTTFSLGDLFRLCRKTRGRKSNVTGGPSQQPGLRQTFSILGCGGMLILLFFCSGIASLILSHGKAPNNPQRAAAQSDRVVVPNPTPPASIENGTAISESSQASAAEEVDVDSEPTMDETGITSESSAPLPEIVEDPEMRTWTSKGGRYSVVAKFQSAAFGTVNLRNPAGKKIVVRMEDLSEEDQAFIHKRQYK